MTVEYKEQTLTFLVINKARMSRIDGMVALETFSKWLEHIAIPYEWVQNQIGIYKRDGLLFPIKNTSTDRSRIIN